MRPLPPYDNGQTSDLKIRCDPQPYISIFCNSEVLIEYSGLHKALFSRHNRAGWDEVLNQQFLSAEGVVEAAVVSDEGAAYLKINRKQCNEAHLKNIMNQFNLEKSNG